MMVMSKMTYNRIISPSMVCNPVSYTSVFRDPEGTYNSLCLSVDTHIYHANMYLLTPALYLADELLECYSNAVRVNKVNSTIMFFMFYTNTVTL